MQPCRRRALKTDATLDANATATKRPRQASEPTTLVVSAARSLDYEGDGVEVKAAGTKSPDEVLREKATAAASRGEIIDVLDRASDVKQEQGWYAEYVDLFNLEFSPQTLEILRDYFYEQYESEGRRPANRSGAERSGQRIIMSPRIDRSEYSRAKALLDGHRRRNEDELELKILKLIKGETKTCPTRQKSP